MCKPRVRGLYRLPQIRHAAPRRSARSRGPTGHAKCGTATGIIGLCMRNVVIPLAGWLARRGSPNDQAGHFAGTLETSSLASMNSASSSALLTANTSACAKMSLQARVLAQLSLFAHGGHVVARIADGAQDAAVFGRKGAGASFWERYAGRNIAAYRGPPLQFCPTGRMRPVPGASVAPPRYIM